jgi:protease I
MQISSEKVRKHVLIISADGFEDSELLQPYQQLNEEGVSADIASLQAGTITGKHGMEVKASLSVDEANPDDYQMLFLPGGKAPAELRKNQRVLEIVRHFFRENKPVAAICHGPQILISAGVMEDRTSTSYPSVAEELREAGANYLDQEVVVDGNLITSRRPDDIPAFVGEILALLKES